MLHAHPQPCSRFTKKEFTRRRYGLRNDPIISIPTIARQFDLPGEFDGADVYGSGHIHETFLLSSGEEHVPQRFILQHLNADVFKDPAALMSNVGRVVGHMQDRLARDGGESGERSLTLVPTHDGALFYVDDTGEYWRVYEFIERAIAVDRVESSAQAYEAAAAFGRFQALLSDLPSPPLAEVIPDFHDTPARFQQFDEALQRDEHNRAQGCQQEIDAVREFAESAGELVELQRSGQLPERVVHNDTKINNVLLDAETGKAVCVIDLDTVMPGLSLYDFGDLVRTATMPVAEDERDLSKIEMQIDTFAALVEGYLATAGEFLNATEVDYLHRCGWTITIETGVRFLADYLDGDSYFRVDRLYQNLDRCRAQFALARSIDEQAEAMQDIVRVAADKAGLDKQQ